MELIRKTTHYVVCLKPRDVVSEDEPGGMPERISKVLSLPLSSIYPVHRLDRATSGVMVYALDAGTAAFLGRAVTEQKMHKLYYAITETAPQVPSGSWTDLLYWDRKQQKSYVVDRSRKGVKEAVGIHKDQ